MIDRLRVAVALSVLAVAGCDQETKEVSVVQQFSGMQSKWEDMALVYGFADNVENADILRAALVTKYPEREYRVVTKVVPRREYERLQKQVAAP
jgi:hypothetical protein